MRERVVVVDHSISSRAALKRLVETIPDCDALCFGDPMEGLAWCIEQEPDLILLDYQMPRPDGLEFIHTLRSRPDKADIPVVMVTDSASRHLRHRALELGATDFLIKPVDEYEFVARVRNLLKLHGIHRALANRAEQLADEVHKATGALVAREREAILCLSRAAERRDSETGAHLVRMAEYVRLVAEALDLPSSEVELIYAAAPMHDVGKIGIADHILLKPGKLDADEYELMKRHTSYGHEILADGDSPLLRMAAEIALSHHERYDGTGYPRHLGGAQIPLVARIVGLADVFDALVSERPYKHAWPLEEARQHIGLGRARQFDPDCVDAFLSRWEDVRTVASQVMGRRTAPRTRGGQAEALSAHAALGTLP